ncbi:hypothetical protein FH972_025086 [Carpinus fangiana]|uniref:Uncharacterized protein n=1 Tax=Carpinus fangiana TaxID=176857 RepID=A0A5N6L005_9ROSI|nr:hypothetical protein FH972_025086 [Carpinus fangiana]
MAGGSGGVAEEAEGCGARVLSSRATSYLFLRLNESSCTQNKTRIGLTKELRQRHR